MASASTVLTLGYGTFGDVNLVPTLGYGPSSDPSAPVDRAVFSVRVMRRSESASRVARRTELSAHASRRKEF